jgi:heptosyltransferase-2
MTTESTPAAPNGIVVISYPLIGDFLRTHALIRLLRERHPGVPIDIVARQRTIELAALMPEVRRGIAETFQSGRVQFKKRMELARQLRASRYRTAVVVSRGLKAAIVPWLARIPERIGWFGECRYPLINRPRFGERRYWRFIERTAALGLSPGESPPQTWLPPQLVVPEAIRNAWKSNAEEANDRGPILVLAPVASGPERTWPVENFAELAHRAVAKGWTVWVSGGAADAAVAAAIAERAGNSVRALTGTPLLTTASQLTACNGFVGNDSGLLHLAAGLGTPSVGIYGATTPMQEGPINANARTVGPMLAARLGTPAAWPSVDAVEEHLTAVMAAHRRTAATP